MKNGNSFENVKCKKIFSIMSDKKYERMLFRRRFCKRIIFMLVGFSLSFFGSIIMFGELKSPRILQLIELSRCPACYGVSVCPEIYSNQILLESEYSWTRMFNAKNIYYGFTKSNRKVVLKKLSHSWELKEFDSKLCQTWGLKKNCKPTDLLAVKGVDEKIKSLVAYNLSVPETKPRKGLVYCPYSYSIHSLLLPVFSAQQTDYRSDIINIWTMLSINPEPIIIQAIPKSKGWRVPAFGGVCGRVELVAYEGEPLSSLMHVAWSRKLKFAAEILSAAMDFTFKHDRFRFYLMDWSIDNIVANEIDQVTFIDLEDVIVVDKHISPKKNLPHWYKRYSRQINGSGFTFSISDMCKHHLSDHNLWAACYVLVGDENPLLYPMPKHVNVTRPDFAILLDQCLYGSDRFRTVPKLQTVVNDMLADERIVGFGGHR
ncbi:divergent protein kinase domain 2A [Plodia interpunctella]|uniref:divergent protein kinase domain 2A n=1 Tax=Plodia interpunctella TaxID=58824 RepID=UPI002367EE72|nr:divergent protein kinase domain 2A [Plodia interpunctella]